MLRKAITVAVIIAGAAAAAATVVVALAFALYALLRGPIGPAWAAASVAAAAAALIGIGVLIVALQAQARARAKAREAQNLTGRFFELMKEKPFSIGGVAVAASMMAFRNPRLIGLVLRTVLDAWQSGGGQRDRRKKT